MLHCPPLSKIWISPLHMNKAVHESHSLWVTWENRTVGKVTRTRTQMICFPQLQVESWIYVSDSHDLGWLALGIRPIPAFGHGYPGGWRECPNIVGFQIWKKIWLPVMENWPSQWQVAKRSHRANFGNKIIKNYHEMRINYSSNSLVRTSILDY